MYLGTTRLRGILRNRWQDGVREDGRIVGGEGWQEKVRNREEWKKRHGNGKESLHSAHANGMNESYHLLYKDWLYLAFETQIFELNLQKEKCSFKHSFPHSTKIDSHILDTIYTQFISLLPPSTKWIFGNTIKNLRSHSFLFAKKLVLNCYNRESCSLTFKQPMFTYTKTHKNIPQNPFCIFM